MLEGTPYQGGLVTATLLLAALSVIAWQNRTRPGAKPFILMMIGGTLWAGATLLGSVDPSLERATIWSRLIYLAIPIVVVGWVLFALDFTGRTHWITRRTVGLLLIQPLTLQLVVWTNDHHALFWQETPVRPYEVTEYGIAFWAHVVYSYSLLAAGVIVVLSFVIYSQRLYRGQALAVVFAVAVPWLTNTIHILTPYTVNLTPLALAVSAVALTWAMFQYGFMDIVPIARNNIVEEMNDGIVVSDLKGRIIDVNRAALPLLTVTDPNAGIGRHLTDVLHREAIKAIRPIETTQTDADDVSTALTAFFSGTKRTEQSIEIDLTPDESTATKTYTLTLSPFYANDSVLTGHLLLVQDVTEHKRRERRLERLADELEQRSREQAALLENLPGMVYRMSSPTAESCLFASAGAQSVTGYAATAFETGEVSLHDLIHGGDRQRVLEHKQRAVDAGEQYDLTYRITDETETQRWVRDVGEGIVTNDGTLRSVEGVVLDVTATKEREQLEVLNRVLRHNIRNEMNVIKGYVELVNDEVSPEATAHLEIVERKCETIMRLSEKARTVQQLLGTPNERTQVVDVIDALSDALFQVSTRYGETVRDQINVTLEGESLATTAPLEQTVPVYGDDLLALGLFELLENAIVHDDDRPAIDVTVVVDEHVEVRITDSGPGIPLSEQQVLEAGIESPLEHSSGMGLWICQWTISTYGGIEFTTDDRGTTATVRLTHADAAPPPTSRSEHRLSSQ